MESNEHANTGIYPKFVTEEELKIMLDQKLKKTDEVRLNFIKDFIHELKNDSEKYKNKKHKYATIKNVLMGVDIVSGGILTLGGIILEVVTLGVAMPISLALGGIGMGIISTLPISHKIADKFTNRTRNFQTLAGNKLNKVSLIFSKAIEDEMITHEEYETILEVKKEYNNAKLNLKLKSKKEIDDVVASGENMLTSFRYLGEPSQKEVKDIKKQVKKDLKKQRNEEIYQKILDASRS